MKVIIGDQEVRRKGGKIVGVDFVVELMPENESEREFIIKGLDSDRRISWCHKELGKVGGRAYRVTLSSAI